MVYNHRRIMIDIYENRRQMIEERYERNRSAFAKALGFSRTAIRGRRQNHRQSGCRSPRTGDRLTAGLVA